MHLYKVASALIFPLLIIACGQTPDSSPLPEQTPSSSAKLSAQVNRADGDCVGRGSLARTDLFKVYQGQWISPAMCFANAGDLKVLIADVWMIKPGNNRGYVETNKGVFAFEKDGFVQFIFNLGPVTITKIHID
jgi:hypothetical protein